MLPGKGLPRRQRPRDHALGGNKAIRDHSTDGESLYVFELLGKGKGYRYINEFVCATWTLEPAPDSDGNVRQAIIFHLVPIDSSEPTVAYTQDDLSMQTDDELRVAAYDAAASAVSAQAKEAKSIVYRRTEAVKRWVLKRAGGICESCEKPAPFLSKNGIPYLEPHHTRRLSDGGPDHPRWVAAICPNCHSEIHYGQSGEGKNRELQNKLGIFEQEGK